MFQKKTKRWRQFSLLNQAMYRKNFFNIINFSKIKYTTYNSSINTNNSHIYFWK